MTNKYELFAPCHFGLEAVLKREIIDLGYEVTEVVDGRVSFEGDEEAIARCNVFLRTTERVMLKVGSFKAVTFDELFEKTKALPWENFIPKDGKFWVKKASSIKSKLFSPSDIQRIVKKAIVDRLSGKYNILRFPEDGSEYPIRITILKDEVTVGLDTSGESLHKRGYRRLTVKAPITETLAAALISLTPWKKDRLLIDPFCGSGTIPIEAALIGLNIAPGMKRDFQAMAWDNILPKSLLHIRVSCSSPKDRKKKGWQKRQLRKKQKTLLTEKQSFPYRAMIWIHLHWMRQGGTLLLQDLREVSTFSRET